jgi:hypothetical protein
MRRIYERLLVGHRKSVVDQEVFLKMHANILVRQLVPYPVLVSQKSSHERILKHNGHYPTVVRCWSLPMDVYVSSLDFPTVIFLRRKNPQFS